jgi:glycosyltransferase involved in cell wall biosynthesis
MSFAVLIPPYSKEQGVFFNLAQTTVALQQVATRAGVRVYVAAPAQEQTPGLWALIRQHYPEDRIFVLENETAALARAAEQVLEREGRLVIHVQGNQQLRAVAPLKRRCPDRLKIVYTVHSFRNAGWRRIPYSWVVSRLMRRYVDYTVFLCPRAAQEFVNHDKVLAGGRGGVMISGVEEWPPEGPEVPGPGQLEEQTRSVLLDPDMFCFLYLATFHPNDGKGHHWLIEGAGPVLHRHRHVRLILAGRGHPRALAAVREHCRTANICEQVHFPGFIDRRYVPWVIAQSNAGIITSRSETFGHTIVEPMAGGKAVISSRVGVAQWLVMDFHTGIGVDYGDRVALGRAIEYFVTHPDDVAQMGRNAQALARQLLTWQNVTASHLRIYQSLWTADQA